MAQNAVQRRGCAVLRRVSAADLVSTRRSCRFSGSIRSDGSTGALTNLTISGRLSDSTGGGNNGANEFVCVDQFGLDRHYAVEQIPIKTWLVHLARFS
jgi:hypothetical protein